MIFHHLFQSSEAFCCERVQKLDNTYAPYTCFVTFATIDPCKCVIPIKKYDVGAFNVAFQAKVTALPNDFDNRFPNLEKYNASSCSIKSISNENFEEMTNLKYLYLDNNRIETIAGETFTDLDALLIIHLRK